jgi:hypothetical protein
MAGREWRADIVDLTRLDSTLSSIFFVLHIAFTLFSLGLCS